jgi:hypothetical protein
MPAIAVSRVTTRIASASYLQSNRWGDRPPAQGIEGKVLYGKVLEVERHWQDRAEVLLTLGEETEQSSYEDVPPNRVFHVKTRYVRLGRGLPEPFDLADE